LILLACTPIRDNLIVGGAEGHRPSGKKISRSEFRRGGAGESFCLQRKEESMPVRRAVPLGILLLLVGIALLGFAARAVEPPAVDGERPSRGDPDAGAVKGTPRAPTLLITGDIRGYLEPCDCKAGVLGGFARRATTIQALQLALRLDAGNMIAQASPYDLLRLRFMHRLCGQLGYDALNVGRREVGFSRVELLRLASESPVPLLSANLTDADGRQLLPGHVTVRALETNVHILGAVTPKSNPGDGVRVTDPVTALRHELVRLEGR
jgi:2',3'-cyclic-nucleotide 2'-phosphodiesterase (5'-nucleotidase family)